MLYMMPRDYNQVVMYFNQDIFDAAGVDYPTAQMSREAFVGMLAGSPAPAGRLGRGERVRRSL